MILKFVSFHYLQCFQECELTFHTTCFSELLLLDIVIFKIVALNAAGSETGRVTKSTTSLSWRKPPLTPIIL